MLWMCMNCESASTHSDTFRHIQTHSDTFSFCHKWFHRDAVVRGNTCRSVLLIIRLPLSWCWIQLLPPSCWSCGFTHSVWILMILCVCVCGWRLMIWCLMGPSHFFIFICVWISVNPHSPVRLFRSVNVLILPWKDLNSSHMWRWFLGFRFHGDEYLMYIQPQIMITLSLWSL